MCVFLKRSCIGGKFRAKKSKATETTAKATANNEEDDDDQREGERESVCVCVCVSVRLRLRRRRLPCCCSNCGCLWCWCYLGDDDWMMFMIPKHAYEHRCAIIKTQRRWQHNSHITTNHHRHHSHTYRVTCLAPTDIHTAMYVHSTDIHTAMHAYDVHSTKDQVTAPIISRKRCQIRHKTPKAV